MYEVIVGLQFSTLIPLVVWIFRRDRLRSFFHYLGTTLIITFLGDIIAAYCAYEFGNNLLVYPFYYPLLLFSVAATWTRVETYSIYDKRIVIYTTLVSAIVGVIALVRYALDDFSIIMQALLLFSFLIFSLHYYYHRIFTDQFSENIVAPIFTVATSYVMLSISSGIMLVAYEILPRDDIFVLWTIKLIFFLLFNVILAFAYYLEGSQYGEDGKR